MDLFVVFGLTGRADSSDDSSSKRGVPGIIIASVAANGELGENSLRVGSRSGDAGDSNE